MELLEGKLTNAEVAEHLRKLANGLQKTIDHKLNPPISQQNPTARRMRIADHMYDQGMALQHVQTILRVLANAHLSGDIVRFPHLEDIRNKKQIDFLMKYWRLIQYPSVDLDRWVENEQETFERMSVFSVKDWKNAFWQLQNLLKENESVTTLPQEETENKKNIRELELEAQAELELLQMEAEARNRNKQGLKGYERKTKPYPETEEKLISLGAAEKAIPEIKLSYKRDTAHFSGKITSSKDTFDFIRKLYEEGTIDLQEYFIVLFLNRPNRIIGYNLLSKGGISGTIADIRLIFSTALKSLSTSIILAHNHPSGELTPSEADISLTRKVKEAGKLMDIQVLDHLILTNEGYYSFTDEGLL